MSIRGLVGVSAAQEKQRLSSFAPNMPFAPHVVSRTGSDVLAMWLGNSGNSVSVDRQVFQAIFCTRTFTVSGLGVRATAGVASSSVRAGIFTAAPNTEQPDKLMATTAKLSCATSGLKSGTFTPVTLQAGNVYFLATVAEVAAPTLHGLASTSSNAPWPVGPFEVDTQNRMRVWNKAPAVAGDFDSVVTSPTWGGLPMQYQSFWLSVDSYGS